MNTQATLNRPDTVDFETGNEDMRRLVLYAARVALSDAKVLITGETGVGKDAMARFIHAHSTRRNHEFVAVNCAGITESLLESELFGHIKGSFTGAFRDSPGKLRHAHGGTLFLDEIGEMTPRMQGMLLRFLENGEIHTVGAETFTTIANVRIIAATNNNLSAMVTAGTFREDLLYRLRVVHIRVPALRDRLEDIRIIGAQFLKASARDVTLTDEAWALLTGYRWPGNIRELQNVMEQVTWLASPGEPVTIAQLPPAVTGGGTALIPPRERRLQVADQLFSLFEQPKNTFWEPVHRMFLARDLTRHDIRELVRRGLRRSGGNYRRVMALFNIPDSDYKRFMNFLCTHDCRPKFREYRSGSVALGRSPRVRLPELLAPHRQARRRAK